MSPVLTYEERCAAIQSACKDSFSPPPLHDVAKAVEQAVLAKLAHASLPAAEDARDAARYRWLRSQHEGHEKHRDAEWFEYTEPTPCAFTVFMPGADESLVPVGCIPGELDEAIDAAMSQDSKGEV